MIGLERGTILTKALLELFEHKIFNEKYTLNWENFEKFVELVPRRKLLRNGNSLVVRY